MTAPVATSATTRPSTSRPSRHHVLRTRRVWRAHVYDHPRRARRPNRARCPRPRRARWVRCAAASAAPTAADPQAATGGLQSVRCPGSARGSMLTPFSTPDSARPVRAAARACVRSLCVRTRAAAGHASAAHCCRTLPAPGPAPEPARMHPAAW